MDVTQTLCVVRRPARSAIENCNRHLDFTKRVWERLVKPIIDKRPHIILPCLGTDGDVYPFLGLGRVLRERGFRATLASHEHFADRASQANLEFRKLVSNEETERLLRNPDFWHPLKGPATVARWGAALLGAHYQDLTELVAEGNVVIVGSPGFLPGRLLNEMRGIPLISVILQPWMLASSIRPPLMMGGLSLPRWAPRWMGDLYWHLAHRLGTKWLVPELNPLRKSLGLQPLKNMFQWWLSPQLIIGMFPEWYGPPQADWPQQLKLAGFPVDDVKTSPELPADLIDFCEADEPPIIFTFGTGMMHAEKLFASAIEACRILGRRGIFLTKFRAQLPETLGEDFRHVEFAPFQQIFPRSGVVVHHGGIGTTAKALAAGVPQLILPFAFDQMDNAVRVKDLGAGDWLNRQDRSPVKLARVLKSLLAVESRTRAQSVVPRLARSRALERAADWIQEPGI